MFTVWTGKVVQGKTKYHALASFTTLAEAQDYMSAVDYDYSMGCFVTEG